MQKRFVAYDGEAYTVEGEHRYVLLANSKGNILRDSDGISSKACFEFLLDTHWKDEEIPVMFGMNYDVNMMLRDFGRAKLQQLWKSGRCMWFNYRLEWIPSKWFIVKDERTGRRVKISEAFGFFQSKFVKALETWNITPQDRDELETMKAQRSVFDQQMQQQIELYCLHECQDLVRLMDALREALEAVDLRLSSWHGAGAVAQALMRKEYVKKHHTPHTELEPEIQHAMMCAYFGGRTELFKQGEFPALYQYDINSAYPYAATWLPSLAGGTWHRGADHVKPGVHGVVHVTWEDDGSIIGPFPYRYKGSRICYPSNGRGWYHAIEVEIARLHGANITVHDAFVFEPHSPTERPFAFIEHYFDYRKALKADGHAGEKVLKLGLNSIYGKLAQGAGYRDKLPALQSYFWAGEITARTRATMLSMARANPGAVVMIATDGIFFDNPISPKIKEGAGLGELDYKYLTNVFTAQPGVYEATDTDDRRIAKSRGFEAKDIDFHELRCGYRMRGAEYIGHYLSTRFIGLGAALMLREMDTWRSWVTAERRLSLYPAVKRPRVDARGNTLHLLPTLPDPVIPSEPYRAKLAGHLDNELDYVQAMEQPLRT